MAFGISVSCETAGQKSTIYMNAFGAGSDVFDYWCVPAQELGLSLLGGIYEAGLQVQGEEQLKRLSSELDRLGRYWLEHDVGASETRGVWITYADNSHFEGRIRLCCLLRERLTFTREAIRMAKESGGVLSIG